MIIIIFISCALAMLYLFWYRYACNADEKKFYWINEKEKQLSESWKHADCKMSARKNQFKHLKA